MRPKRFKVGKILKTTRFVPGYPVGIPTGALVTVADDRNKRYQVKTSAGTLYWVDSDAVEELG